MFLIALGSLTGGGVVHVPRIKIQTQKFPDINAKYDSIQFISQFQQQKTLWVILFRYRKRQSNEFLPHDWLDLLAACWLYIFRFWKEILFIALLLCFHNFCFQNRAQRFEKRESQVLSAADLDREYFLNGFLKFNICHQFSTLAVPHPCFYVIHCTSKKLTS